MKTKKSEYISLYGSTMIGTQYPLFVHEEHFHVLPRPYISTKPDSTGQKNLSIDWFTSLVHDTETQVITFLVQIYTNTVQAMKILHYISFCKEYVPLSLRICGTFFTHMTYLGALKEGGGSIPVHFDKPEIITALFHPGEL